MVGYLQWLNVVVECNVWLWTYSRQSDMFGLKKKCYTHRTVARVYRYHVQLSMYSK